MKVNKQALIIGAALVMLAFVIGRAVPSMGNPSPIELYQIGMVQVVSGIMDLIGWTILFVTIIIAFARKPSKERKCSTCGAIAASKTDKFCQTCGSPIE